MSGPVARAPGKLVLSGAYSVLWGAPCLVAAADRYAVADRSRPPTHVSEEVKAAIELGLLDRACFVDVSDLRAPVADKPGETRKIGLGSSAAIVVATLAAARAEVESVSRHLPRLFRDALAAHRIAQRGGSGVDVAASVFGGVLSCSIAEGGDLDVSPAALPEGIQVRVLASAEPASTQGMVARVRAFETAEPARHAATIGDAARWARAAARASTAAELLEALHAQDAALRVLAREASVPIFPPELDALCAAARDEGAFFGPSGAGGGDISILVSVRPPGDAFSAALRGTQLDPLSLQVGAPGVRVDEAGLR